MSVAGWVTTSGSGFCTPNVLRTGRFSLRLPHRTTRPRALNPVRRQAHVWMSETESGSLDNVFDARKRELKELLLDAAPKILEQGWRGLVRWRAPLFAPDVKVELPFASFDGRVTVQLMLRFMHVITVWKALEAEIYGAIRVSSPRKDQLVVLYRLRIPCEKRGVPPVTQDVRVVVRLREDGLVVGWKETWSLSTEEVLEKVWSLADDYDSDAFDNGNARLGVYMPRDMRSPQLSSAHVSSIAGLGARMDALVEFLARGAPKLANGQGLDLDTWLNVRKHYAEDAVMETPLGRFEGADSLGAWPLMWWMGARLLLRAVHVEPVKIQRQGINVVIATYAMRAQGALGGKVALVMTCRFYCDATGKIARQVHQTRFDRTLELGL